MSIQKIWDDRAKASVGTKYKGVLFSRFPDVMNDYLHGWTTRLILDHITKPDGRILDVGCGYGRLSLGIRGKFPQAFIIGVDISPSYAKQYAELVPRAFSVVSDSVHLPFRGKLFDVVLEVFSLMYLPDKKRYEQALGEMFASLCDRGSILIIENNKVGTYLLNGLAFFSFRRHAGKENPQKTKGLIFQYHEIEDMVRKQRGEVIRRTGMPVFTLLIPLTMLLSRVSERLLRAFLSFVHDLDEKLQCLSFLSLYHFYLVQAKREE